MAKKQKAARKGAVRSRMTEHIDVGIGKVKVKLAALGPREEIKHEGARASVGLARNFLRAIEINRRGDRPDEEFQWRMLNQALEQVAQAHFELVALPLMEKGTKFNRPGRGAGPIRKAIAKALSKNGPMKNAALWLAVSDDLPSGWDACDNRLGKYFEGPAGANVGYARFCNVASEERDKLKA